MTVAQKLEWMSQATDTFISSFCYNLGGRIHSNPWLYMLVPFTMCIFCIPGIRRIRTENNPEKLYTPQNAEAFRDRGQIEVLFGYDNRRDYAYAIGNTEGENLLTSEHLESWLDAFESTAAMTMTYAAEKYGNKTNHSYSDLCVSTNTACLHSSVLAFWNYNRSSIVNKTTEQLTQDIVDQGGRAMEQSGVYVLLDHVAHNNSLGLIVAFQMTFQLKNEIESVAGSPDEDSRTAAWELQRAKMTREETWGNLNVVSENQAILEEESAATIRGDIPMVFAGYCMLVCYAVVVLSRGSYVHTHGTLALASFGTVGLATAACFGLGGYFGIPFSEFMIMLVFLLLGLGLDDTFVLVGAFQEPDLLLLHPKERTQKAMSRAGASILVTSTTDVMAFLIGSITPVPAIQAFCWFAAIGVTLDFVLQTTFFVAIMIYSAKREEKGRYDCICCVTASYPSKLCCSKKTYDPKNFEEPITKFLRDSFAPRLMHKYGKALVLCMEVAMIGTSVWEITQLEVNMNPEWFIPSRSYLQESFRIRDEYFGSAQNPSSIYTFEAEYESASAQNQMQVINDALAVSEFYVPQACRAWWPEFISYASTTFPQHMDGGIVNSSEFYNVFTQWNMTGIGAGYSSLFIFDNAKIIGSKTACLLNANYGNLNPTQYHIKQMDASRDIAALGEDLGPAKAYVYYYLWWDGLKVIWATILLTLGLALAAVLVICIVLLGNVLTAFTVFFMVLCIDVAVLGSFYYTGLDLNYVTGIFLVLTVGLSVDACAHISHSFLAATGTGEERAIKALGTIGRSVLNGAISTMLVLVPLVWSQSYIYQVFFRCFFSIIGHSIWHGLFVLPVLLSIFNPASYETAREHTKKGSPNRIAAAVVPSDAENKKDTVGGTDKVNSENATQKNDLVTKQPDWQ